MLFLISLTCLGFIVVVHLVRTALKPGVRDVPGPFLAKFTDLFRAYYAYQGILFKKIQEWQKQYGNYVRIGPNTILVSESDVFQEALGARKEFPKVRRLQIFSIARLKTVKSDFQKPWKQVINGKIHDTLASTQSKRVHAELKRPVATIFSMTNILSYEPKVESTLRYFIQRLDEDFLDNGKACDINNWLQYCMFHPFISSSN
jgi:hypothetical protein